MRPQPNKLQCLIIWFAVNQDKIGFDMAIAVVNPIA
jgi:hypothetical protein